jgi:hypothetical protein
MESRVDCVRDYSENGHRMTEETNEKSLNNSLLQLQSYKASNLSATFDTVPSHCEGVLYRTEINTKHIFTQCVTFTYLTHVQ